MNRLGAAAYFAIQTIWFSVSAGEPREDLRLWRDTAGRELKATYLYFEDGEVGLRLSSGREAVVGIGTLSAVDRAYVLNRSAARVSELPQSGMPRLVSAGNADVAVEGGPRSFATPWFRFENDVDVSPEFVREAAQVFEATRRAVKALPLGFDVRPSEGQDRFLARFVLPETFAEILRDSSLNAMRHEIAGIYEPSLKSIVIPYDQIGARREAGRMTLHRWSDTSTLIHEITHQVMHDRLPLMPIWLSEGLAEYMAAIPYREGTFDFGGSDSGLRHRLGERHGGLELAVPRAEDFLERSRAFWEGQTSDYAAALIYVYFFMHLDQPRSPGAPLATYLILLDEARNDLHSLITEYNAAAAAYNEEVAAYNREVESYRHKVNRYQGELHSHSLTVEAYQEKREGGVPPEGLAPPGARPEPPEVPTEPEMPGILRSGAPGSPVDLYRIANDRALPSLLRGRDHAELEEQMTERFAALGITVRFASSGQFRAKTE